MPQTGKAFPQPDKETMPATLPFPGAMEPPKPVDRFHAYYEVGGVPIHLVGERWHAEDASASSTSTFPDPAAPGLVFGIRAESDQEVKVISRDEYRERVSGRSAGSQIRPQAGLRQGF